MALQKIASKNGITRRAPKEAPAQQPEPPKPVIILRPGPCDRGDREYIRRRLACAAATLAKETRRMPSAVLDAIAELAAARFEAPVRLSIDYDAAYGRESEAASTAVKGKRDPRYAHS